MTATFQKRAIHAAAFCLAVALIFVACGTASACPSCQAALAAQEGQGDLVKGFFWSILFMLTMPFAILGSFTGYMYLLVRRARRDGRGPTQSGAAAIAAPSNAAAAEIAPVLEREQEPVSV